MNATPSHIHSLCPDCDACPAVEFYDDGTVRIGEAPSLVTLRREEWNELVKAIRSGQLAALDD